MKKFEIGGVFDTAGGFSGAGWPPRKKKFKVKKRRGPLSTRSLNKKCKKAGKKRCKTGIISNLNKGRS